MVANLNKPPTVAEYEGIRPPTVAEYEASLERPVAQKPVAPVSRRAPADVYGDFDVWAAPPSSQIWKSPGADFVAGFGAGWVKQTQLPALLGIKPPPPKNIAEKIGEGAGRMMEVITEFIGLGAAMRGVGLLSKTMPKGAWAGRALQTGALFGTQQITEEARKATAEAIYGEDFGTRGGRAVLESFVLGAVLSLAGSGARGVWNKLKPSEQALALETLGLKKGASLSAINKAARMQARKFHPDKVKGMRVQFDKVIKARDALRRAKAGDVIIAKAKQNFKKQLMLKDGISSKVADTAIKRLDAGESIEKVDQMISRARAGIKPLITPPTKPIVAPERPVAPITPEKAVEAPDIATGRLLVPEGVKPPPGAEIEAPEVAEAKRKESEWFSELSTAEHLPNGSYILINTRQDTEGRTQVRYKPEDGARTEWIDTDQNPHEIIAQALGRTFGSKEALPKNLPAVIAEFIEESKAPTAKPEAVEVAPEARKYIRTEGQPSGGRIGYVITDQDVQIGITGLVQSEEKAIGELTSKLSDPEFVKRFEQQAKKVYGTKYTIQKAHQAITAKPAEIAPTAKAEAELALDPGGQTIVEMAEKEFDKRVAEGDIEAARNVVETLRDSAFRVQGTPTAEGYYAAADRFEADLALAPVAEPEAVRVALEAKVETPTQVAKQHRVDILPRKAELLKEIDAAIAKAPEKADGTSVHFEINGGANIFNEKKALQIFRDKVKAMKPTEIIPVVPKKIKIGRVGLALKPSKRAKVTLPTTEQYADDLFASLEQKITDKKPTGSLAADLRKLEGSIPQDEWRILDRELNDYSTWNTEEYLKTVQLYRSVNKKRLDKAKFPEQIKPKGKPGFVDVRPLLKVHKTFMGIVEPSKAVEIKLGKEPYAAVIKGVHETDVGRIEFNEAQIEGQDKSLGQLSQWFNKFPDKDLRNFMISRGAPRSDKAKRIQYEALGKLPKELKRGDLFNAVQRIADSNYKFLQSVVGDDINRVEDYFYGIYKNPKKVEKFLDYWRTTKRFTKEKKLPTVADAIDYGLELRNYNPIENLKAEYVAISHLRGMNWLKEELLRTGKGKFIDDVSEAPLEWDKVHEPVFRELRLQPDLAKLINNLIATNKITRIPLLNTLREINNVARTIKFIGSAFHLLSVAKQSIADSGYLGFLYKPTATRGFTRGFRANDPIFRTTAYKDYIRHGGGHRYSVESEARRAFTGAVNELNRNMGKAIKVGALPLKIPTSFVNWMFQSYIPKVKYAKFLDVVAEKEKKFKRKLTSPEKIDIIKEQQNFYGMMNERLFGRSGTVTTATRFWWMSPGYAEGNYRSMLKALLQWGGKGGANANRSRSNIINSWLITATAATVGTLIFTGKPPKKPEVLDDARDLFKIDTGKKDEKGRQIMIDLMTYDKDYWNVAFNTLRLRPDVAIGKSWKRIGGMKAPTAEMIVDLSLMAMGKAIYDWKGDRVVEITDPFLLKAMKLTTFEIKKLVPISVSVFQQSKKRDIDTTVAAIETLLGFRPTKTEKDLREQKIISKMYSLAGQREELSYYIGQSRDPKKTVARYNKTVNDILNSPYIPKTMKNEWSPRLLIEYDKVVTWKRFPAGKMTNAEMQRAFDAHTLSIPYKRRGEPFRMIGEPKKGSERRVTELKAEAKKRGIILRRSPRKPPKR